jgi:hydrogenase expression/formation protein HypD
MKYLEEFKDKKLITPWIDRINDLTYSSDNINLMEVCGTHTVNIHRYGIKSILPENIKLISGPGCPVCVTSISYIDKAIEYAEIGYTILTFGDMLRVPGTNSSFEKEKAKGKKVIIVYSPSQALEYAEKNPEEKCLFLAVGFETTAPLIAGIIEDAKKRNIKNLFFFSAHKLIPPAMKKILDLGEVNIDGFICPGHVSTIIGSKPYEFIANDYKIPCVIAGFEPLDIIQSIYFLLRGIYENKPSVFIQYQRVVKEEGNLEALRTLKKIFNISDGIWRGLGIIEKSELRIKEEFEKFDIEKRERIEISNSEENPKCRCGEVLRGLIEPTKCSLFAKECNPQNPIGPCMVSSEGTCSAYYKYGR